MKCPKCNTEMRYCPEAKNVLVNTLSGVREWNFYGFHRCIKGSCRYIIEDKKQQQ